VLLGAGVSLWLIWNVSTAVGYLLSDLFSAYLSNFPSPDFIVASTFLGYLIIHWQESPTEHFFIFIMTITSIFLSYFFQSSTLLIIILILGIFFAMAREINKTKLNLNTTKSDNRIMERK
jgi:predicted branched-subunit amino acid permease